MTEKNDISLAPNKVESEEKQTDEKQNFEKKIDENNTDKKQIVEGKLLTSDLNNLNHPLSIRILQVLIQFLIASLFTTSAFLVSLQAKQVWYQYQYNAAFSLTEDGSSQYVHHFENAWHKFSLHNSDHFEFSNGLLKVNTSLYAF